MNMKSLRGFAVVALAIVTVLLACAGMHEAAAGVSLAVVAGAVPLSERAALATLARFGGAPTNSPLPAATWGELLEARNSLMSAATQIIDRVEAQGRSGLTDEEADAHDLAMELVKHISNEIVERDKRGDRGPRSNSGRLTDPVQPGTGKPVARGQGVNGDGRELNLATPFVGRFALDMFGPAPTASVAADDFARAVLARRGRAVNEILNAYGSEGVGSDGGYSVPPQFAWQLWDASLEGEIVRPRAHVVPMQSNTLSVGGFDTLDHSAGSIGGFVGAWAAEGGTFTPQKPKLRSVLLSTKKLGIFGQLTNEVVYDSPSLWRDLYPLMSGAIGWNLDDQFINGAGAGKPRGVLNDAALITITKESGQAAGTLLAANVLKMYAQLHPACIPGAVWMTNANCLPQLMSLSINAERGTDGLAVVSGPMLKETAPGTFTMMGLPVIPTEKVPSVGTKGDLILADWGQYFVGLRREIMMDTSNAPGWSQDMTDFRSIVRTDGIGKWSGPMTPKNGSPLSWCVVLETR